MFFLSHPRCFGPLGIFQHNIKISIKTARVSRLCVSYDYGETKFELEINPWDSSVNQSLVLRKSHLHPSLEKYGKCTRKFFFHRLCNPHQKIRSPLRFLHRTLRFYPCLKLLNRTMMNLEFAFGCLIYFLVLTGFTRCIRW